MIGEMMENVMTNPETVQVFRDREGKIHETREKMAESNLFRALRKRKNAYRNSPSAKELKQDPILDFLLLTLEAAVLEHAICADLQWLESTIGDYITDMTDNTPFKVS